MIRVSNEFRDIFAQIYDSSTNTFLPIEVWTGTTRGDNKYYLRVKTGDSHIDTPLTYQEAQDLILGVPDDLVMEYLL